MYDIFLLANEENNEQIIDETLRKFKNLKEEGRDYSDTNLGQVTREIAKKKKKKKIMEEK